VIRAVVWKELREQGLIAVMLAVLGGALLAAAAAYADPPSPAAVPSDVVASLGTGRLLALMLVVTAGMVCGGALFAAEREAGTMAFLDALPTLRWALWRAKVVAGLVQAGAVVAVLLAATAALGLGDGPFLRRLTVYAVLAFAWGTLGSTLARTTLGSVGVAIPAATLAAFAYLLPISVFLPAPGTGVPLPVGWVLFEVLMLVTPLAVSAWRFTATDRARAADAPVTATAVRGPGPDERRPGLGARALLWLALRQLRVTGPVLSAFALGFGMALLLPDLRPVFLWPPLALVAGVLAGVTVFGDEQSHRTALFWGEHRLPVGRAWWVKVGLHLALLAWLLVLLALPCAVRAQFEGGPRATFGLRPLAVVFHSRVFDELGPQGWKYLLVPAVYGFVFGHVCGFLFHKPVVACGVAVLLGAIGAVGWGPSLLAGGLKHWQVWLPPALVLLTGRLIVRAWAAERVGARGPVVWLLAGGTATLVAFGIGIGYRVLEVHDDPTGADDIEFVATLPPYDENLGGNKFRATVDRFARTAAQVPQSPPRPGDVRRLRIEERLELAVRNGWTENDPEMIAWLDRVFTPDASGSDESWPKMAADAANMPLGVYELPGLVNTPATTVAGLDNARKMTVALLARGLQKQAEGDPAEFVSAFRIAVMLARTVRYGSGYLGLAGGIELERVALSGVDVWLDRQVASVSAVRVLSALVGEWPGAGPAVEAGAERLIARTDLMTELVRTAVAADDPAPFDPRPHILADRFVLRGTLQAPAQRLAEIFDARRHPERAAAEADLVALGWAVPWERERTRRLIGLAPEVGTRSDLIGLVDGRPAGAMLGRGRSANEAHSADTQLRVSRRVAILKAAVLAYQTERGHAPPAQTDLVGNGYLTRLPDDPYAEGRPLGYRVSDGQPLVGRARSIAPGRPEESHVVQVRAGQVVVWSVGSDGVDQGGRVPPGAPRAEDLVYIVPIAADIPR
jgi:hypothetical protein